MKYLIKTTQTFLILYEEFDNDAYLHFESSKSAEQGEEESGQ
jgi:hypothetical protein